MITNEVLNVVTNEVLKTIYQRRAVRKYKLRPVDKKLIEQMIDAAKMAPSAMNRQAWKFYVLTDKTKINKLLAAIKRVADKIFYWTHGLDISKTKDTIFYNAPVVIFVTAPKKYEWAAIDIGMCCQNLMLAAKSLGLDTCPIGFARLLQKADEMSLLPISESEQIHLAIVVGYGDEIPDVYKRKGDNVKFIES